MKYINQAGTAPNYRNPSKTVGREKAPLLIKMLKCAGCTILITLHASCHNENSIILQNIKVLYEKDAVVLSPLHKTCWKDITCPPAIDTTNSSRAGSNCYSIQKQGWKEINQLSDIELQDPLPNNINFFWLRGEFNIDGDPGQYYGAYLSYVNGRDVMYINNRLIGMKKIKCLADINMPSQYIIPPGVLVKGKNSVNIRLEISNRKNRGVDSTIFIQPRADYDKTLFWDTIWHKDISGITFVVLCGLFIISIIQIIIDKKEKTRLISLLGLLYIAIGTVTLIPLKNLNLTFLLIFMMLIPYIFIIILIYFSQAIYGVSLTRENRIIIPLIAFFAIMHNVVAVFLSLTNTAITLLITFLSFSFCATGYIFYKLHSVKSDRLKLYFFSLVLIIFIINTMFEYISLTGLVYWPSKLGAHMFPVYMLLFIIYNTFEIKKKRIQLQQLYVKLQEAQSKKIARLTITDTSEQKLGNVIDFIHENYTEDISREGLAAAVDLNPNYLSSLFKTFTGKKIQEYINLLRIKEAARQIEKTDNKIIDIAFSVGFENLSTFIRAFKKELGKTPTEYREENK